MIRLVAGTLKAVETETARVGLGNINPKRLARLASAELKLEQEQRKSDRAVLSKQQKDAMEERKWEFKKEKAKRKTPGKMIFPVFLIKFSLLQLSGAFFVYQNEQLRSQMDNYIMNKPYSNSKILGDSVFLRIFYMISKLDM